MTGKPATQDPSSGKSGRRGRHPKNGLSRWLWHAPASATFSEVVAAYKQYDEPAEAWPEVDHAE